MYGFSVFSRWCSVESIKSFDRVSPNVHFEIWNQRELGDHFVLHRLSYSNENLNFYIFY